MITRAMMVLETLSDLFRTHTGEVAESAERLPAAGSDRQYVRMRGATVGLIGVYGACAEENRAFILLARHFGSKRLPVPEVYAHSGDYHYYLQEDLGDTLLFDAISEGRKTGIFHPEEVRLLKQTMALLPDMQFRGAEGLDFGCCYPLPEFNRRSVLWDLNYFKYCFLKPSGVAFSEDRLEDDFEAFAGVLTGEPSGAFMYRDFQLRNVMLRGEAPCFIDFQGGRRGPVYYDVASFLWQASAHYPEGLREELLEEYMRSLERYEPVDRSCFRERLRHFVLFRLLQVLGAYGFRGYFERKSYFVRSVPAAMSNLREVLERGFEEYPSLCAVLRELAGQERFREEPRAEGLEVTVYSFAYGNGIPEDGSGHGGGFVFDCRALHNPGRYEEYKSLTGRDEAVVRFLEGEEEVRRFLEHVYALVDASVERYRERGFTHLTVAFGCTGGRHRSVYAAQRVAEHVAERFGVKVVLKHREQHIVEERN